MTKGKPRIIKKSKRFTPKCNIKFKRNAVFLAMSHINNNNIDVNILQLEKIIFSRIYPSCFLDMNFGFVSPINCKTVVGADRLPGEYCLSVNVGQIKMRDDMNNMMIIYAHLLYISTFK